MSSINDIWQKTLDAIESEIPITSFKTWFNDTTMIHLDNKVAVIKAETEFQRDWLENHYSDLIQKRYMNRSVNSRPSRLRLMMRSKRLLLKRKSKILPRTRRHTRLRS